MCACGQVETAYRLGVEAALRILEETDDLEKAKKQIEQLLSNRDAREPARRG